MTCTHLHDLAKRRNQRLGQPEGEDELGPCHEQLGCEALEEGRDALVLHHARDDAHAALGVLKVPVLDARLDDIERRRHDERGRGTGNGGDKVLAPAGLVVVAELVEVLLGCGRTTEELAVLVWAQKLLQSVLTYRERTGRVTGGSPAPTAVQTKALVGNDPEQATTAEGLWVGLALDLEHVEGQQHNLTNANQGTGGRVHDGLAVALAKRLVERVAVVAGEVVARKGLSAVLVDALEDLGPSVVCCVGCGAVRIAVRHTL